MTQRGLYHVLSDVIILRHLNEGLEQAAVVLDQNLTRLSVPTLNTHTHMVGQSVLDKIKTKECECVCACGHSHAHRRQGECVSVCVCVCVRGGGGGGGVYQGV